MKSIPIVMPQMGQSVAEGTVVKWRKKVGEAVKADEIVVEIESDKVNFEVESPVAGTLSGCLKAEGDRASVGETIGHILADQSDPASAVEATAAERAPAGKPHAGSDKDQILVSAAGGAEAFDYASLPDITRDWYSPYVLRMAVQNNISQQELKAIRGSGRQGRVTKDDLLKYMSSRGPANGSARGAEAAAARLPDNAASMGEVISMTAMRRTIADHMVQSIHTSAHVTMVHAVDMTQVVEIRDRIKEDFLATHGVKMGYTAVVIFVTSRILRDFPTMNASVYGSNILRYRDINIGCAVALPDESLVVPVIKNADHKSFVQISQELDGVITQARRRSLTRSAVEGGTFTLSNFGSFGSLIGTPLINQPQVAILGMGAVFKAPVVVNDQIRIRDQLYLSLSFDHRVIDGAMGGRFLNAIQKMTESLDEQALGLSPPAV